MYCTPTCFKNDWKRHCESHPSLKDIAPAGTANAAANNTTPKKGKGNRSDSAGDENEDATPRKSSNYASSESAEQWETVSTDATYIPFPEDTGCILQLTVTAMSQATDAILHGPVTICTEPVLAAPRMSTKRQFVSVPLQQGQQPVSPGTIKFRVLSYNVLAELYATKQAYPYCDAWSLSWPFRRAMIMQEIEEMQGDIVCLQEVQMDHFELHLSPFMHELGFDGLFKCKSRESMGQYGKVDGCATFWKLAKFSMTENYTIEFNDLARQSIAEMRLEGQEERKYMNRLLKDNVAQVVVLEVIPKHGVRPPRQLSHLCIVNTHLYSNVTRPDVKLWQSMMLTNELQQFAIQRDLALIICGDFNSEPESAVHELLTEGSLQRHHPELDEEDDGARILPEQSEIYHNLDLASAMQVASPHGQEPLYTNYTRDWKGTLDYIMFSPMRIRLMSVAAIPSPQELEAESGEGLPSAVYPSDHLMLCADVALSITGNGSVVTNNSRHGQYGHQNRKTSGIVMQQGGGGTLGGGGSSGSSSGGGGGGGGGGSGGMVNTGTTGSKPRGMR
jgi:CCR4-NOT transcription complex subunit 6